MATLFELVRDFLKDNIEGDPAAGDPPPPGKLGDIAELKDKLTNIEFDPGHNGIADWLDTITATLDDVPLRDTLVVRALQLKAPRLAEAMVLAGLVEIEFRDTDPPAFAFRLAWNKLYEFMRSPGDAALATLLGRVQDLGDLKIAQALTSLLLFSPRELLKLEYAKKGYASLPDPLVDDAIDLIGLVSALINSPLKLGIPVSPPLTAGDFVSKAFTGGGLTLDYLAILGPDALGANRLDGFGIEIKVSDATSFASGSLNLTPGLKLAASTTDSGPHTYRLVMKGGTFDAGMPSTGTFEAALSFQPAGGTAVVGPVEGTRLEAGPGKIALQFRKDAPLFSLRASLERLAFVLSAEPLGVLSSLGKLPAEFRFQTDVSLSYLQGAGLQVAGLDGGPIALATEFNVPANFSIGSASAGLAIDRVKVRVEAAIVGDGLQARTMLSFGATGGFGPVRLIADGIGAWFGRWGGADVGVMPPTTIGLSLDAGPVSGGGFLTRLPRDEYAGVLKLKVIGVGVSAFALYGKADGAPAFVGILGIRLPPPGIQIGFGFAVSGIGGIVGINRRVDSDVLRDQIASGTSAQLLFCEDPTQNALNMITQAQRMFPDAPDVFLIGPTFQISWLELVKLDAGVFLELPGPRQIIIAGSARLVIGPEALALVYLRMDFVGGVDLTKSLIYFDAALVNSSVMQVFKITGGVALRIAYGENAYFLFSVGGFHPSFNPGGLEPPRLARVGTCTSVGIAWFKLENYFALTSNTFQVGASVEAAIEIGPIAARGWVQFDALVQFEPFHFVAAIDAGFDVEVEGVSLCGVRVQGSLSGPGPLVVQARASVKILFVRISESVTIPLGSDSPPAVVHVDIIEQIADEFAKIENIRSEGEDGSVILRSDRAAVVGNAAVVGVFGAIVWEQKRVPFGLDLQRFEGAPLSGIHHLLLSPKDAVIATEVESDWFGVGTYLALSDSEALNNARFAKAQSGIRIPLDKMASGNSVGRDVSLDLVKLPEPLRIPAFAVAYMSSALTAMQADRAGKPQMRAGGARVKAGQEEWVAHSAAGAGAGLGAAQAFSMARTNGGFACPKTTGQVSLAGVF